MPHPELAEPVMFDPLAEGFVEWPYDQYRRLRAEDPIHRSELLHGYCVTRYADVSAILRDATVSSEIDKADPDVPNDLLVSLGSQRFRVEDLGREVTATNRLLVFITSNNERSLPAAFLRRCVIHNLGQPSQKQLVTIAQNHFPRDAKTHETMFDAVAARVVGMRDSASDPNQPPPSTAEYLDAVRACLQFEVTVDETSEIWKAINTAVLEKKAQGTGAA